MGRLSHLLLWKLNLRAVIATVGILVLVAGAGTFVYASSTSNFQQTINAGTLAVDIVDGSYVTVASPSVVMSTATFSFACQTITGTFGSATQNIYVSNPDAADNGWTASLAASATTAIWDSVGTDYDFNDNGTSGCADSAVDTDALGGQMTVDPSVGTLATGQCNSCVTTNITKGSSTAFLEGTTNSITVLTAAALSNDIGDWKLTGVSVSQKIPEEQPAASDYDINMVLSIVAS
ncbi:MAG: hypothetical protein HY567_01670 [Candidatus Kerfeldbacteria bacterium]|nr:hypothetical protein [Candidatus Kerfeldbacteria bacterium]